MSENDGGVLRFEGKELGDVSGRIEEALPNLDVINCFLDFKMWTTALYAVQKSTAIRTLIVRVEIKVPLLSDLVF